MRSLSPKLRPHVGALLLAACLAALPLARARACATCSVGDPTLTTFGLGQPFAQRLRLGARYEMRTTDIGAGTVDAFVRREHQTAILLAYTPFSWLTIDADLPLVHVQLDRQNGAEVRATSVGDLAGGARAQLFGHKARGRNHSLWSMARLVLPSAPELVGDNAAPLPLEEQTGTGAFIPQLGLGYAYTGGPVGAFLTLRAELPSRGFQESRPGRGLFATLAAQWQPRSWVGLRLSWEQGYEATALEEGGVEDPDSGGILWSAALQLLLAPTTDLVVAIGGQVPVWQRLQGLHEERPVALASLIYDIGGD